MKITKIEIQNFKAFKEAQPFAIDSRNVLAFGNNGSGKSSFYFALHAFLQSSVKSEEQRGKYFIYNGNQSLLNIYAPEGFPSYIRITTDNGQTYEFSPALKEGNIANTDNVVKLTNESSDFMNYRLMYAFANFRNSQDADIFPVFYNEFFPYWTDGARSYQEWYDDLFEEVKRVKAQYDGSTSGVKRGFWKYGGFYDQFKWKLRAFNDSFQEKYRTYIETINDLMRDHFLKGDNIKLLLEEYQPLKIREGFGYWWELQAPKLIMTITKDDKPIPKPHVFLNEARLTGIALATRMAVFSQRYKGETDAAPDFKLLVLDDLLLSLDMSKRMGVINYILTNQDFSKYQLFILTHDKGFYSILRNNLATKEDEWKSFEFYENNNPTEYKNPIVIESLDSLKKAEELLKGNAKAVPPIPPKYDECALYLRKKAEELIRVFFDPTLENLSRFDILEKLSNALKGMEKEFYYKQLEVFNLLVDADDVTPAHFELLKEHKFEGDGTLSGEEIGAVNKLRSRVIKYIVDYRANKATHEKVKDELLKVVKEVDELRDRILNHGAHPTAEPLFAEELGAGIDTIEKFEEELKAKIEWFKKLQKETLKLK